MKRRGEEENKILFRCTTNRNFQPLSIECALRHARVNYIYNFSFNLQETKISTSA